MSWRKSAKRQDVLRWLICGIKQKTMQPVYGTVL